MQYNVMVTAGANQAFVNVVLTLLDPGDSVVLFVPYYFNHLMAIQMTGGATNVVYGRCDAGTLHPDLDWLEQHLQSPGTSSHCQGCLSRSSHHSAALRGGLIPGRGKLMGRGRHGFIFSLHCSIRASQLQTQELPGLPRLCAEGYPACHKVGKGLGAA